MGLLVLLVVMREGSNSVILAAGTWVAVGSGSEVAGTLVRGSDPLLMLRRTVVKAEPGSAGASSYSLARFPIVFDAADNLVGLY